MRWVTDWLVRIMKPLPSKTVHTEDCFQLYLEGWSISSKIVLYFHKLKSTIIFSIRFVHFVFQQKIFMCTCVT